MNKFTIDSKALFEALKKGAPAVNPKTVVPVCANVHIKIADNMLTLTTTDTHLTIINSVPCSANKSFTCLIPHNELLRISGVLNGPVTITVNSKSASLECGDDIFKIGGNGDIKQFPKVEMAADGCAVNVDGTFFWALRQALKCVLPPSLGTSMEGVSINIGDKKMHICGTDRLQLFHIAFPIESDATVKTSVRVGFVQAVKDMENAEIKVSGNQVICQSEDLTVICTTIDNPYPNYLGIIPVRLSEEVNCELSAADLRLAVDKIITFPSSLHDTRFTFRQGAISISYINNDLKQEVNTVIKAVHSLPEISVKHNARLLKGILSLLPPGTENLKCLFHAERKMLFILPDVKDYNMELLAMGLVDNPQN